MLQPKTVKLYVNKLDKVALQLMGLYEHSIYKSMSFLNKSLIFRMLNMRDSKNELPANFKQWINRWALESMGVLALDTRFGLLDNKQSVEAQIIVTNLQEFFELTYQLDVLPSIWRYYKTASFKRLITVLDRITEYVLLGVRLLHLKQQIL